MNIKTGQYFVFLKYMPIIATHSDSNILFLLAFLKNKSINVMIIITLARGWRADFNKPIFHSPAKLLVPSSDQSNG